MNTCHPVSPGAYLLSTKYIYVMKTTYTFLLIFLFPVSVCYSQTMKSRNILYQYCCSVQKIQIETGIDATIEGFNESDITKINVKVEYDSDSRKLKNRVILTSGGPYTRGTEIKTEETSRAESFATFHPININQYWNGNTLTLFVNIVYDRKTYKSKSFIIGRADKGSTAELKKLDSICPPNLEKPVKTVALKERLNSALLTNGVYLTPDAIDLLKAFNPSLGDSVKADVKVRMPPFPVITQAQKKAANKNYKESRKPDAAISAQYDRSAALLSDGISSFLRKKSPGGRIPAPTLENKLKEINYYCLNIRPYSKKIGRKTMNFLSNQTNALNAILQKSVSRSRINDDEMRDLDLLMNNIYLQVKKIADRYHVKPFNTSPETGYLDQSSENTFYASTEPSLILPASSHTGFMPLPDDDNFNVCYKLTWWERIFRPRTERKLYVYVYKCPDPSCPQINCSSEKGCFNGCENQYIIVATSIGGDYETFYGKASVASNTLPDATWTFNIYEKNSPSVLIKSMEIDTRTAICETNKKQLQLWVKLDH